MKTRRSAKKTPGSSSLTMPPALRHAGPNTNQLKTSRLPTKFKERSSVNMTSESPSSSMSSKRTRQSRGAVSAESTVESRKTKKRRLEEVLHRVCVICTEVEEVRFPEVDSALKQKQRLDQFSTLLGSCQLNILDSKRWTVCDNCCSTIDELRSILNNIKNLEAQVNQLAVGLYIDLQKCFPNDEERDQDDSLDDLIYYRSQLFENRKTFVFQAKPQTNIIYEVTYLPDAEENVDQPENSLDAFLPLHDDEIENDYTEELQNDFFPHEFKVDEHRIEDATTEANDENSDPSGELEVYECSYVGSKGDVPCRLAFNDEKLFEMHTKAHTVCISLGPAKKVVEQHGLKVYTEMLKQQNTSCKSQSLQCPLCGKAPFKLRNLKRHIKRIHKSQIHSCPNKCKKTKCSELFPSKEDLMKHLQSCHLMDEEYSTADKSEEELDRDNPIYPERVENGRMLCAICQIQRRKDWTHTTYIKHVLTSHKYFVCNHKDPNGLTCLGALKTEGTIQNHLREKHDLNAADSSDLEEMYLDPRCHTTQCPICGMKDLHKQVYVDHLREHGLLACGESNSSQGAEKRLCTRAFDLSRDLDVHLRLCHAGNSSTDLSQKGKGSWCRICKMYLKCKDRSEWLEHVKKHGGIPCNIYDSEKKKFCQQLYISGSLMKSHIETEHPTAVLNGDSPPVDNGGLNALDLLKDGQLDVVPGLPQDGRFECKLCHEVFEVYDQNWVDHVRSHGGMICGALDQATGKPCLTLFYYFDRLYTHCKLSHDKLIEGAYFCKVCRRGCSSLEEYQKHQRLHGDKRGLICEKCGQESRPSDSRLSCLCSKVCVCEICGKDLKKLIILKAHMAVDHEGHREVCKICGKEFKRILNLRAHLFRKHGEGEGQGVECSVCKKTFLSAGILASHFKDRHGEKKFKCTYDGCTWGFTSNYALKGHIAKVHEKLRPYICDTCGSTFKTKDHWATHCKKHEAGLDVKIVREVNRGVTRPDDNKGVDSEHPLTV